MYVFLCKIGCIEGSASNELFNDHFHSLSMASKHASSIFMLGDQSHYTYTERNFQGRGRIISADVMSIIHISNIINSTLINVDIKKVYEVG